MTFEYDLNGFGSRLKSSMEKHNLTSRQLGAIIQANYTTIQTWIDGIHYPNGYYIVRLCMVLDVSADYLLFGKEI